MQLNVLVFDMVCRFTSGDDSEKVDSDLFFSCFIIGLDTIGKSNTDWGDVQEFLNDQCCFRFVGGIAVKGKSLTKKQRDSRLSW